VSNSLTLLDDLVLPAELASLCIGYESAQVLGGCSGSRVYRLLAAGRETLFLKCRDHAADILNASNQLGTPRELHEEYARLAWLGRADGGSLRVRLGAPELRFFGTEGERDFLLITVVPGVDASDAVYEADPDSLVQGLAEGLRRLHTLSVPECPFDRSLDEVLAAARLRLDAGLVDATDFDEERQGRTGEELWEELLATRPATEDRVFTHGDYCLPNVLLTPERRFSGLIDWSRCGIADRYQDLALARRSLAHNWGAEWEAQLWEAYGLAEPDPARLQFYQLLDEFF
jgi:aminoglycoside phosphotransferase